MSDGRQFISAGYKSQEDFCAGEEICKTGDFNGDGKDDVVSFVRTNHGANDSDVYVALSDGTTTFARYKKLARSGGRDARG